MVTNCSPISFTARHGGCGADVNGINDRFDFSGVPPRVEDLGTVHLIAIGGAGMSAVARLLMARGVPVQGSDAKDSPLLRALAAEGARVWVGHDRRHLEGADTVVISSAIRDSNPELAQAKSQGLRILHRSQALAATAWDQVRLAVAGANGKTTTTSLLIAALDGAGASPSFASGGELADRGTNADWHADSPFVIEADESDGSFLVYHPHVAAITNVQPDHLDFYGTFDNVRAAYAAFAATVPPGGLVVACADDEGSNALAAQVSDRRVLTYGHALHADLVILESALVSTGSTTTFRDPAGVERTMTLAVPGAHNVLNACAAYLCATEGVGAHPDGVVAGLARFAGARRRFEVIGEAGGITVVDDYAHNAGKVEAVVATATKIAHDRDGRLIAIFQPHLYSRTRDFAEGFAAGLAPADEIALLDIYGAREEPIPGVDSRLIADRLAGRADVMSPDAAVEWAASIAKPGDVVLTIGAGDITVIAPHILERLGSRR